MDIDFWQLITLGFFAQLIDGALGMAYGTLSATVLLSLGLPPSIASASVHTAEIVTTGISGASHYWYKNIDFKIVKRIAIPGIIGAIIGAYILTEIPGNVIKPYVSGYLFILGIVILLRALSKIEKVKIFFKDLEIFALFGGFLDTIGGGGWGPILASSLIATGRTPRYVIGSVNFAEFFISLTASIVFILTLNNFDTYWKISLALLIGGAIAAPFAAKITQKIPRKLLMFFVGCLIVLLSLNNIFKFI
ncbi:MAG: sulfite exporter TauE/SafE family protein [Alphaproteobacteria bacterium]|nr:sulfite exporter TauE/SafE family protein [Alphaproteobacteria bacterium]